MLHTSYTLSSPLKPPPHLPIQLSLSPTHLSLSPTWPKTKYKNKKKTLSLHSTHSVSLTSSVRQDSNSNFSGFFVPPFVVGTPSPIESLSR
ncbi:hypothetical protein GIB67_032480 [Kingdonia uniflora]|uniref:Uncharacterized protein n=1 Tax=Kingdonia uniflora TaxID=39325 RepID=A0A7J7L7G7_9MAGN|nr:hypothetical protein GIB67_032480 [Kingdonia uniflora]